jgi:hypothetical protein
MFEGENEHNPLLVSVGVDESFATPESGAEPPPLPHAKSEPNKVTTHNARMMISSKASRLSIHSRKAQW